MLVEPAASGSPLPLTEINQLQPGERLQYVPVHLPAELSKKAEIAVVLIPDQENSSAALRILAPKPARAVAEWPVPIRASVVGLVFGEHGLNVKKVSSLVQDNPQLVSQLTSYADQSSKVEALVQTLSQYEQSVPGSSNLQAMLRGFSSQYDVSLPRLDSSTPADQQATALLRAVVPAFQADNSASTMSLAEHSTGLAASVASMFFGSPVGLAAGGAALLENLHTALFPGTDFRPAFTQHLVHSNGLALCSGAQNRKKTRKNITYLWMQRIPDAAAPKVILTASQPLPIGWKGSVAAKTASVAQLKLLSRARNWRLVSGNSQTAVPVAVTTEESQDQLTVDLTHVTVPAGEYKLVADWDWNRLHPSGDLDLRQLGDLAAATITPASADRLIAGLGKVNVRLTGAEFDFIKAVTLRRKGLLPAKASLLPFHLEHDQTAAPSPLQVSVDTASLPPGSYLLQLKQINGKTHDLPLTVHPPNPAFTDLPIRVNVGEKQQNVVLDGSRLDHIERITSSGLEWHLSASSATHDGSERQARVTLDPSAKPGDVIAARVFVKGLPTPLFVPAAVSVLGPRPRILSVIRSFSEAAGVELRHDELPADVAVSFLIHAEALNTRPAMQLSCDQDVYTRRKLSLQAGDKQASAELESTGKDSLFLSLDPGSVGQSGCTLVATITTPDGSSNPYPLGQVIRLPRIENFTVSDKKLGPGIYAGTLTGTNLQTIAKTGWSQQAGSEVRGIATPVPGKLQRQTLEIAVPWPPPSPHAPLYLWLQGDLNSRLSNVRF